MRWPRGLLCLLILAVVAFVLSIHLLSPLSTVIRRYPGDARSSAVRAVAAMCDAGNPAQWGYGHCSGLISCILDNLDEIIKSDLSIGATIIGLLPSIMVTTAAQPEDIIKLALVSPLRGIAVAAFSVGISPSIFSRLKPIGFISNESAERTWVIPLARVTTEWSWRHLISKLLADIIILTSTGIMLWQNWTVNSAVLVQWLCESPLMVFTWPLISMFWVAVAVTLLYSMAEKIVFKHITEDVEYAWWQVFLLPYTLDVNHRYQLGFRSQGLFSAQQKALRWLQAPSLHFKRIPINTGPISLPAMPGQAAVSQPAANINKSSIRVIIKIPHDSAILSWQNYLFVVEFCAIAIYFYATFVLLSVLFLGAVGSVRFASLMAGLYAVVRLVESVC